MEKPPILKQAAVLRDRAATALRLSIGLQEPDHARLVLFGEELRKQADELERQAAAETPSRPPEPRSGRTDVTSGQKPGRRRGGSNDPEPQT
jgi:hypothetical protein